MDDTTVLKGDVIIDSVNLQRPGGGSNHGVDDNYSLYANGHMLIIGTGVDSPGITDATQAPQVFGGSTGGDIGDGDGWSTDVIIHSGVYYNVIAGSYSGKIDGSTNLVLRGGVVLDTVIGGNSINEANSESNNLITESTYVYVLNGAVLPGDFYEESYLQGTKHPDLFYRQNDQGIWVQKLPLITESTILTGGSNNGDIDGDTNVVISDGATLWDVQGGGRRGESTVTRTANVTVSGDATVKHMVCGSITDGLSNKDDEGSPRKDKACVGGTHIIVRDEATVGSVFGGGYDTYYKAEFASMIGSGSSILVEMSGGTVGYVYGGGYRGDIGTPNDRSGGPLDSVTVSITGGTVLCDVFGGGRGGLDKVLHDISGASQPSASEGDTTGYSRVYAETVSVKVSGDAVVMGNVYGGGESTPVMRFGNTDAEPNSFEDGTGVASVVADSIRVEISDGAKVHGSVYGAGKGVDANDIYTSPQIIVHKETSEDVIYDSVSAHSSAFIIALEDGDSGATRIPWSYGSDGEVVGGSYGNYASVEASTGTSLSVTSGSDIVGMSTAEGRTASLRPDS